MSSTKPTSRFILFTLSLLLLLTFFTTTTIVTASDLDDEVDTDFEELLALDEQEDQEQQGSQGDPSAKSEAEITVKSLLVNNFYVGEGSDSTGVPTKMLTVNGSLKISVYNPATLFGIHVSSTPVNLVYSEIVVATGQLKKYYQPRKSHRTVSVNLEGNKVPLYGAGSSLSVNSQTGGEVSLTLKFEIKSKGEVVGKLVKTTHKKQVLCSLNIDILSTKPIKFKKSSCTYM